MYRHWTIKFACSQIENKSYAIPAKLRFAQNFLQIILPWYRKSEIKEVWFALSLYFPTLIEKEPFMFRHTKWFHTRLMNDVLNIHILMLLFCVSMIKMVIKFLAFQDITHSSDSKYQCDYILKLSPINATIRNNPFI